MIALQRVARSRRLATTLVLTEGIAKEKQYSGQNIAKTIFVNVEQRNPLAKSSVLNVPMYEHYTTLTLHITRIQDVSL
eukprot:m.26308 g.26308  ORF g.26308 m.26308 type:complete len:78 (-) comp7783_c0_seq1:104-337(-)